MTFLDRIVGHIELHDAAGIRTCFANGISPNDYFNNRPLIYELTSEYTRSPRFKDCVNAFVDHGLIFEEKILLSVLRDDAARLDQQLREDPAAVHKRFTLRSAYTPLYECSLLHVCAEFNHAACARVLLDHGADVNEKAGVDDFGFGGQTPIFHTVNQNSNQSADMLRFLLDAEADLYLTVPGILWGKGYEWETLLPAVNPLSYAMMGLLPQMHRDEVTIANVVSDLLLAAYQIRYHPENVPCAYLKK